MMEVVYVGSNNLQWVAVHWDSLRGIPIGVPFTKDDVDADYRMFRQVREAHGVEARAGG